MRTQKDDRERGSAILELALGVTLLVLLLAGVIGYGPMLYTAIEISDAARAGAVYGSTNPGDINGMQNAAIASARDVTNVTATATQTCQCYGAPGAVDCSSTCSGNVIPMMYVTVTAQTTMTPVLPYPLDPGTPFTIRRTTTMRAR